MNSSLEIATYRACLKIELVYNNELIIKKYLHFCLADLSKFGLVMAMSGILAYFCENLMKIFARESLVLLSLSP